MSSKGLLERLRDGESVIVAEGYIFEFERRGFLKAGSFVPEVVVEQPHLVRDLHREYVHAGSDVVLAFTYYAHREKLRLIGREGDIEAINMKALEIAREVADETGTLMAGNICNTTVYKRDDPDSIQKAKEMNREQIEWAVKGGADFIVGETYGELGEALLALESIKEFGNGLPAVITLSVPVINKTFDGVPIGEACRRLEEGGAAVVGLNCGRGPKTMIDSLKLVKDACKGPLAALPVPYRTTPDQPTFFSLKVPNTGKMAFPLDLHACLCTREDIYNFATECKEMGIQYIGLCCGNSSNLLRIIAEVYEKDAPALKYSPEMEKHFVFGDKEKFSDYHTNKYKSLLTDKEDKTA